MIEIFLSSLKNKIETQLNLERKFIESKGEYNGFESLVSSLLTDLVKEISPIVGNIDYKVHFGHHFPDIDIIINSEKYGLELKSRNQLNWTTNGNSVFESITNEGYTDIYLLFGALDKNNKSYCVKYAPYWRVLSDIKVTHSPRFFINMDLEENNGVFTSQQEYNSLRSLNKEEKNKFISNKLRTKNSEPQWYLPEETNIEPLLFTSLPTKEKERVISELFILFAEDLLRKPNADYKQATVYMISEYYYYNPSFRDIFSAGGQYGNYPRMFKTLSDHLLNIEKILTNSHERFSILCSNKWKREINQSYSLFEQYCNYLDDIGKQYYSQLLGEKTLSKLLFDIHSI